MRYVIVLIAGLAIGGLAVHFLGPDRAGAPEAAGGGNRS